MQNVDANAQNVDAIKSNIDAIAKSASMFCQNIDADAIMVDPKV